MSSWIEKFRKIVDYKMSLSPIRGEIDDIGIYMDAKEYHDFVNEFKSNIGSSVSLSVYFDVDTVMFMGVKFLVHRIDNI